jgi:hypothetical protein
VGRRGRAGDTKVGTSRTFEIEARLAALIGVHRISCAAPSADSRGCRTEAHARPFEPTSSRASHEVLTPWKCYMRIDSRLIGFTAHRVRVPLSKPTHAICSIRRSLAPIKERAHPSVRNSSSEFLRSCTSPFTLRCPASPASGFRSLFATSLESSDDFSRSLPRSTSLRPQAFTASRRFLPLSSSRAYFIPQPRPGSSFVQGLLSRRSHPSSSEGAFLHAVAASLLLPTVRLSPARL